MFIDSHCHLSYEPLRDQLPQIRQAMQEARVSKALCICTTLEEFESVHALALGYDNFWCSVGVHPDNEGVREPAVQDLLDRAALPRVVAIGETGLDYYRLGERSVADMQWQRDRFEVHIEAARLTGLPLVVHTRSASSDTLDLLRSPSGAQSDVSGVFHCFTETLAVARAALDLGFFISFSGIVTFKSAKDLQETAARLPLDRLLVETDSPFLAPVPHRGKPCEPAFVADTARFLADLRGESIEDLAAATSANFLRLFAKIEGRPQA
jgi:TatD DNase family protein